MAASVLRNVLRQRFLQMKFSNHCRNKILPKIMRQHLGFTFQQKLALVVDSEDSYKEECERQFDFRNLWFVGAFSFFGMGEEKKEDELIHTIKLGVLSMQQGKLDIAEDFFQLALKMAEDLLKPDLTHHLLDMLANIAFQKGEFEYSEKLLNETMNHLLAKKIPKTDNTVVDISLKLAVVNSFRGDKTKAEAGFLHCIKTQQAKLDDPVLASDEETQLLWFMGVDYYARHLLKNSHLTKAKHYFEEALKMSIKLNGEKHPQTIVLLNDLGGVTSLLREYDLAQDYLSKAIKLGSEMGSRDLPEFYCNMGAVLFRLKKFEEAKEMCENGVRVAAKYGDKAAEFEARQCLKEIEEATKPKEREEATKS